MALRVRGRDAESSEPVDFPYFAFVVPAHNEAAGIARTVRSLLGVDYPTDRFSVLVLADNCTDNTKELAEAAGARVIERSDSERRGKGYALELAFSTLLGEGLAEAVVVVDADTDVDPYLLKAMAKRLLKGELAMQAHYAVRNVDESWRTQLMGLAFALYHGVRSSARERLGLSTGLRGNGMGFAVEALRRVAYKSYSLVEDVEYGVQLGLNGIRIAYIGEAEVRGEMVAGNKGSESQRRRWEQGRNKMLREYLATLIVNSIRKRDVMLLDLALDLITPPLATVVVYTGAGLLVVVTGVTLGLCEPIVLLPWALSIAGLSAYIGSAIIQQGPRSMLALAHAPKYIIWKLGLRLGRKSKSDEWVRTQRVGE